MKGGNQGGMNMGVSNNADLKEMILAIMNEMQKQNKFIHKNDIYTMIQGKHDYNSFENAMVRLCEDGNIYSTYDKDIFALN